MYSELTFSLGRRAVAIYHSLSPHMQRSLTPDMQRSLTAKNPGQGWGAVSKNGIENQS